jgi:hypothetical protein
VADIEVRFAADQEVRELCMSIGEELKGEDNCSVCGILEGDNTECCFS